MGRIAYLVGESGAGKSSITHKLRDKFPVVVGDQVIKGAAKNLPGEPFDYRNPERWISPLKRPDAIAAFRTAVTENNGDLMRSGASFLAEATLFGYRPLRQTFEAAIAACDYVIESTQLHWLDVAPEELLRRIVERGRKSDAGVDLLIAKERLGNFERLMDGCQAVRSGDSDELLRRIQNYLT